MTIKQKEEQILRIKQASFEAGLNEALEKELRSAVVRTVQTTLEAALVEEVEAHLAELSGEKPRRSGYYERTLETQYGAIEDLAVPKLRNGNAEREWQILQRYERSLYGLLDYASYLYVMGLSLRDLQEALYFLLDKVLSLSAVNRVTLRVTEQMQRYRQARLTQSPAILLVDGVWVEICYAQDESKIDQAGHQRQCRAVEERVILAAMAIYPDGSHSLLHYTVCLNETSESWLKLFDELIQRGLDPAAVQLIVSDGAKGLLDAMKKRLPQAKQQRCITHKVRGMEQKLTYQRLDTQDAEGHTLTPEQAKTLRRAQIFHDAYDIYKAPTLAEARTRLRTFIATWRSIEPAAVRTFTWGIRRTFLFYSFDSALHPLIRTTNALERFFREFRNKADEIGSFPNEQSCLTLFFLVLRREHTKHNRPFLANNS